MIYGLYLSASGVLANSHKQDVIANNLANAETVGFKRDLAMFQERPTEAKAMRLNPARHSNPMLEMLGGGIRSTPPSMDLSPSDMESTSNPWDVAIAGKGFFAVRSGGQTYFTRDGRFTRNSQGNLALTTGGQEVLDDKGKPIALQSGYAIAVQNDGTIIQDGATVARLGVFEQPERSLLRKCGRSLMASSDSEQKLRSINNTCSLQNRAVERSNVDSATELTALMDTQRQLEANANMIRYQDQTLSRLVNDVGKIG